MEADRNNPGPTFGRRRISLLMVNSLLQNADPLLHLLAAIILVV